MDQQRLRGVMAPVLTPMDGNLNPDVLRWIALCKELLSNGCTGLAPFGTTSEANSLGIEERIEMLDRAVEAGIPASKLVVGTGTCALPDTVRLSAHAATLKCAGILLLPPFYYKGVPEEGIYRSVAELLERVGDSSLKIYLYHIPPVAVVGFSLALIERLKKAFPMNVVGMKDSSADLAFHLSALKAFPDFDLWAGTEKLLLANLAGGGVGTISAMANVIPAEIRALYESWREPGAEDWQSALDSHRAAIKEWPLVPALKAIKADETGVDEWRLTRPPLVGLGDAQAQAMLAAYRATFAG
ncbi:MAG: dihydrodipicolinate synthase [Spirochaetes bacterium]|nr:MAG: dihydrodipicolinate synthase [Spirochaetota bacterium]